MIPVSNLLAYIIGPVALTQPPWMVVAVSVTAVSFSVLANSFTDLSGGPTGRIADR